MNILRKGTVLFSICLMLFSCVAGKLKAEDMEAVLSSGNSSFVIKDSSSNQLFRVGGTTDTSGVMEFFGVDFNFFGVEPLIEIVDTANNFDALALGVDSLGGFIVVDGTLDILAGQNGSLSFDSDGNVSIDLELDVAGTVNAGAFVGDGSGLTGVPGGGIPTGGIIMWSGSIASVPSGWALCNGSNGTPDLRDRFVVGATQDSGGVASTNITGSLSKSGSPTHDHGAATGNHTLTISEMPSHSHTAQLWNVGTGPINAFVGGLDQNQAGGNGTTNSAGGGSGHNHTISGGTVIPSYFALAFIMKL